MKKSIRINIMVFVVIPFLVIYAVLSAFILNQVYRSQVNRTRQELVDLAEHYEAKFKNFYQVVELSVQISAAELEMLNPGDPAARSKGEDIILSRFRYAHVINVWLVFEPNAFDGRDALHGDDYPGAPSGRYIRSFSRKGNSWETAPDIDEDTLNSRNKAYWYTIPRDTGAIFTDLGGYELLWDYKTGNDPVSAISVVAPVFRDNRVIGCVGLDVELNETILGEPNFLDASSGIFLSDGQLGYSVNTGNVGKTPEELGFTGALRIREAVKNREELFLYNEYSELSGTESFCYFRPVKINDRVIYIYSAIPQDYLWQNMIPVLKPIGTSLAASLIMFSLLLIYLSRGISKPLQTLTRTSEAIAAGDLDIYISYRHSGDELDMITKSLSRMVEQFKTSKLLQRRYQDGFDSLLGIHYALFRSETLKAAFDAVLQVVAGYFSIHKASLVFAAEESPRIVAVYPPDNSEEGDSEFFSHLQVLRLLGNKKILVMNYGALSSIRLSFVDFTTKALCILPLPVNGLLKGYIIMQGTKNESFVHDDTTLLFIGDTLAYLLNFRANWEKEISDAGAFPAPVTVQEERAPEQNEGADDFLEKVKTIADLDISKGLLLIGGGREEYSELLRVTIHAVGESIEKMHRFYTENPGEFGIEVHGMKGALYSIGAENLGEEARKLEFAAKSGDTAYCISHYPEFEEKLKTLSRNLSSLFAREERNLKTGDPEELERVLEKALEACKVFDSSGAQVFLARVKVLKWEDDRIREELRGIEGEIENIEYKRAAEKIEALLQYLRKNRE